MNKRINRVIFILSILGILIAAYVLKSYLFKSPIVCLNSGCELVRKNPASYIYGIPIPAFGFAGYTLLAILAFTRTLSAKWEKTLLPAIVVIAAGGVAFVSWFTYTEIFIIKAICTWCAVSAINMLTILVLSLVSLLKSRQ